MIITITNLRPEDRYVPLPQYRSRFIGSLQTITLENEHDRPFYDKLGSDPKNQFKVMINEGVVISSPTPKEVLVEEELQEFTKVKGSVAESQVSQLTEVDPIPQEILLDPLVEGEDDLVEGIEEPVVTEDGVKYVSNEDTEESPKEEEEEEGVATLLVPSEVTVSGRRKGSRTFTLPDEVANLPRGEFSITKTDHLSIDPTTGEVSWTKDVSKGEYLVEVPVGSDTYVGILTIS